MEQIFPAHALFTGTEWLYDHAAVVRNGTIEKVIPQSQAGSDWPLVHEMLIPAFIDAQVYGAAGRLFSVFTEPATLETMQAEFYKTGTVLFLPTLATNTIEIFRKAIDAVRDYWKQGGKGVPGLHLEGPWLNAEKRGAHIESLIHSPTMAEVRSLLEYGSGVIKMITVAPENCSEDIIDFILSKGIILSAGHSNAHYDEALRSFDRGIRTVTHLYNAMSPLHHRQPGLTGAALDHEKVMASIIPDGHHVDFGAVSIAKKIMKERLFAITDAVTDTETGPYRHERKGDKYECNGVLSGSALTMHAAFVNLVEKVGIEVGEAIRMCSLYPAKLLGCDDRYGKIAPGYSGQFVSITKQLQVVETIIA